MQRKSRVEGRQPESQPRAEALRPEELSNNVLRRVTQGMGRVISTDNLRTKLTGLRKLVGLEKATDSPLPEKPDQSLHANYFSACKPPSVPPPAGWGYLLCCPLRPEEYQVVCLSLLSLFRPQELLCNIIYITVYGFHVSEI